MNIIVLYLLAFLWPTFTLVNALDSGLLNSSALCTRLACRLEKYSETHISIEAYPYSVSFLLEQADGGFRFKEIDIRILSSNISDTYLQILADIIPRSCQKVETSFLTLIWEKKPIKVNQFYCPDLIHRQIRASPAEFDYYRVRFKESKYLFRLLLHQPAGAVVGVVELSRDDYDLTYLNFTFEATKDISSSSLFEFDSKSFQIRSNAKINSTGQHFFRIYAYDTNYYSANKLGTPITFCSVIIDAIEAVNQPPVFNRPVYEGQLIENNAPGSLILKVEAINNGYSFNSSLIYQIVNSSFESPFQIKSDTGEIFAKRILNAQLKTLYEFEVLAVQNSINGLNATCLVRLHVVPQRDHKPVFEKQYYSLTIPENKDYSERPIILEAIARDPFNESQLVYSLSGSLNDLNTFEIDASNGSIRLVSKLNYELKHSYKLSVIASTLGQPPSAAHADIEIHIEDINEFPPVFSAPFYEFILFENVPIGHKVGQVNAYDRESLTRNSSLIKYLIVNRSQAHFPFEIESESGMIYTSAFIKKNDREKYEFDVMALNSQPDADSNHLNSSIKVKIKILDINDEVPKFTRSFYEIHISEDAVPGLPLLTLDVIHKGSKLKFSIESGDEERTFGLIQQSNRRVFLTLTRSNLNYKRTSFYDLVISVMDQDGLYSICNVQVTIDPSRTHVPRFTKDLYIFNINESAQIGSLVGSINAVSLDIQSSVNYRLITNADHLLGESEINPTNSQKNPSFRLDKFNGNLYVSSELDCEKVDSFTLYVSASDPLKPYKVDHAIVQIKVHDVNDNPPVFSRQIYKIDIHSDLEPGAYLERIQANDQDQEANGKVRYAIAHGEWPVSIDPATGIVRLSGYNHMRSTVSTTDIEVMAYDLGQPSLNSTVKLIINYLTYPRMKPVFDIDKLELNLIENQPIGISIGDAEARNQELLADDTLVYILIGKHGRADINQLFSLIPSGKYNRVSIVTKFRAFPWLFNEPINFIIRARSANGLFCDIQASVNIKALTDNAISLVDSFKIIFNNFKKRFITETAPFVPFKASDPTSNLTFSLADSQANKFISVDFKTGSIKLKSVLNSNNRFKTFFRVRVTDQLHWKEIQGELVVSMLTEKLLEQSVTLSIQNLPLQNFLNYHFNALQEAIATATHKSINSVFIFDIREHERGLNISVSVAENYEKDHFVPAWRLKQIIYAHQDFISRQLKVQRLYVLTVEACRTEPCLNYQRCSEVVSYAEADSEYLVSTGIQFRSINVNHDFKCECPTGFTGANVSLLCDVEINLCYSNPCGQNGFCISLESSYVCICDPGFTGVSCEINTREQACPSDEDDLNSPSPVCRGDSKCKNLILGGFLCDECLKSHPNKSELISYYNEFCELRARHFPNGSYMALDGIRNRQRFSLKLTFATIHTDGFLLFNGQLNSNSIKDFFALKIRRSHLLFEYSLGEKSTVELELNSVIVSDGKWRTLTISYSNREFNISLDDDNFEDVDACVLGTVNCVRIHHIHELPLKCNSQIANCFRHFDLDGPLIIGSSSIEIPSNGFGGCIKDLFIENKRVNLNSDIIREYGTKAGCSPKVDRCPVNGCKECQHIWNNVTKCECDRGCLSPAKDSNRYTIIGHGYLSFEPLKTDDANLISFYIKFTQNKSPIMSLGVKSFRTQSTRQLDLVYDEIALKLMDEDKVITELKSNINDGFWNLIEIKFLNGMFWIQLNQLFTSDGQILTTDLGELHFLIGSTSQLNQEFNGCIANVQVNSQMSLPLSSVNCSNNCFIDPLPRIEKNPCDSLSLCKNNGSCIAKEKSSFVCKCAPGYKGTHCEHISNFEPILHEGDSDCPAKWWGKELGICGPCNCDESKNFSPDCNKLNGDCVCRDKYYLRINQITGERHCVPCDCSLQGSTSLQCAQLSGQCSCIPGVGITGRRCDRCVSPFAEIIGQGSECRQLSSNHCPTLFEFGVKWPRTEFGKQVNATCPRGAYGKAFRSCSREYGWLNDIDISDCRSKGMFDETKIEQLIHQLSLNATQMNSYLAFKTLDQLNEITLIAEEDEELTSESLNQLTFSMKSLYARDLLAIQALLSHILSYELSNAPSFLFIQDKNFFSNLFSTVSRLIDERYELRMLQASSLNEFRSGSDLIIHLYKYLKNILKFENKKVEKKSFLFKNTEFRMQPVTDALISSSALNISFKIISVDNAISRIGFIALSAPSVFYSQGLKIGNYKYSHYKVVSNILALESNMVNDSGILIVVKFKLERNYDTIYDSSSNRLVRRKTPSSARYKCVILDSQNDLWRLEDAKLLEYEDQKQVIKCTFSKMGVFAVLAPISNVNLKNSEVIQFDSVSYASILVALLLFLASIFWLALLRQSKTALTIIYIHLCINLFLVHTTFLLGINSNGSFVSCKLIAIIQHYFHLGVYFWLFVVALHLYRMLTELRDINKVNSPAFYYVIAYGLPTAIISLTLGLKPEVYTNCDMSLSYQTNLYCWLRLDNLNQLFYALLLPLGLLSVMFLLIVILSYFESKKTSFKQTDPNLVRSSLSCGALLFIIQAFNSFTMIMLLKNALQSDYDLYLYAYEFSALLLGIFVLFLLVLFNNDRKCFLFSSFKSLKGQKSQNNIENKAFDEGSSFKTKFGIDVNTVNVQHVLKRYDYQELAIHNQNSASTTSTSGTLEEIEGQNLNSQKSLFPQNYNFFHVLNTKDEIATERELNCQFEPACEAVHPNDLVDIGEVLNYKPALSVKNNHYMVSQVDSSLNQFWPSKLADCDTSFWEGSTFYTPARPPYIKTGLGLKDQTTTGYIGPAAAETPSSSSSSSSNFYSNDAGQYQARPIIISNEPTETINLYANVGKNSGLNQPSQNEVSNETRV
nr:G protein-coupled receptor [Proales similis]